MKITINPNPQYWGSKTTDSMAKCDSQKMAEIAENCGFTYGGKWAEGTTDEQWDYYIGDDDSDVDGPGLDWFSRWCSHGFRGMELWLKKQVSP